MSQPTENAKKIRFMYEKDPNYRSIYSNGVLGGVTSNNEIHMELFLEMLKLPEYVVHEINAEGGLGKVVESGPASGSSEIEVSRTLQVAITMKIENAEIIGNWLLGKVKEAKEGK